VVNVFHAYLSAACPSVLVLDALVIGYQKPYPRWPFFPIVPVYPEALRA